MYTLKMLVTILTQVETTGFGHYLLKSDWGGYTSADVIGLGDLSACILVVVLFPDHIFHVQ